MNNFQSLLVFCVVVLSIMMMFPSRAQKVTKSIVAIMKSLPMSGITKILSAYFNKTRK